GATSVNAPGERVPLPLLRRVEHCSAASTQESPQPSSLTRERSVPQLRGEPRPRETVMHNETQTQRLARKHVSTIADTVISNISKIQKLAAFAVYGPLAISYFHQVQYLYTIFLIEWVLSLPVLMHAITS